MEPAGRSRGGVARTVKGGGVRKVDARNRVLDRREAEPKARIARM
jgi:hypothetical protein